MSQKNHIALCKAIKLGFKCLTLQKFVAKIVHEFLWNNVNKIDTFTVWILINTEVPINDTQHWKNYLSSQFIFVPNKGVIGLHVLVEVCDLWVLLLKYVLVQAQVFDILTQKPGAVFTNKDQDQIKFEKKVSSEPWDQIAIQKPWITWTEKMKYLIWFCINFTQF